MLAKFSDYLITGIVGIFSIIGMMLFMLMVFNFPIATITVIGGFALIVAAVAAFGWIIEKVLMIG